MLCGDRGSLCWPGLPPRSQPGSAGGSAEALDAQSGAGGQQHGGPLQRWPGAPAQLPEPQSSLEKQVTSPCQANTSVLADEPHRPPEYEPLLQTRQLPGIIGWQGTSDVPESPPPHLPCCRWGLESSCNPQQEITTATYLSEGHVQHLRLPLTCRETSAARRWTELAFSSEQTLPHSELCMQVDFGGLGLGDGSSDLEHSIMLRQRSLSSRTSLDDAAK